MKEASILGIDNSQCDKETTKDDVLFRVLQSIFVFGINAVSQ